MTANNSNEIYVGLMSGTSLDGVDVAIVDFGEFPPRLLYCNTAAYEDSLREELRHLCHSQTTSLDDLYSLDARLGETYAEVVNRALDDSAIESGQITAIGCHGQTIRHSPDTRFAYSAQIGDPNRVATRTGITTVADFRGKDIALGGQAAPLAPAFHRFLFRSDQEDRAVINIGGISNITFLPANPQQAVLGFDTGPGNTFLDLWSSRQRNQAYDAEGAWARSGTVDRNLLERMLTDEPYFRQSPPKSTGTEYFSPGWLEPFLDDRAVPADVQATLVELTAASIAMGMAQLPSMPANCYICGGGAHNLYLRERLAQALPGCGVQTTAELGLDPDFVEATAFAWLARERINLRNGSIAAVTKAQHAAILGGVYAAD